MKSIFRYPGGKGKKTIQDTIRSHFPEKYSSWREPFCGGGSMYFSVPPMMPRWINDRNGSLISVYLALRDRPEEFIAACREIGPERRGEDAMVNDRGTHYPRRLKETFNRLLHDESADTAIRYFFLNRTSWNGRVILEEGRRNRTYFSNPKGWNLVHTGIMELAAEYLKNTEITSADFEHLLLTPGEDVLVYCDPPYVRDTELPQSAKLYECGFSIDDHYRLKKAIKDSPHKVCLSYDDHPLIRDLYRHFFIHEAAWTYCGTVKSRRTGRELVITNYEVKGMSASLSAA